MQYLTLTILVLLISSISFAKSGLVRAPKIYNAVITSDANLEPSRTYPIIQPVLSVGVQPVIAAAAIPAYGTPAGTQHGHLPVAPAVAGYYPIALGGLYPALYPALVYQQPTYAAGIAHHQQQQLPAFAAGIAHQQLPTYGAGISQHQQLVPEQVVPEEMINRGDIPFTDEAENDKSHPQFANMVPDSSHHHADPFNNHNRLNNPDIPDVPPPPLPVSASKMST